MDLEEMESYIIPETIGEISSAEMGGSGEVWMHYNEAANNLNIIPLKPLHFYTMEDFLLQWVLLSSLIYLVILLIYYIVFRCKKNQNPLKYAFKRSRLWWVIILLIPAVIVVCLRF